MIPKNKFNLNIEAFRGIAAALVFFTHWTKTDFLFITDNNYFVRLVGAWGTEAVVVFFVLSGIVIHASFENSHRSNASFLANRVVRLHPILFLVLLFTIAVDYNVFHHPFNLCQLTGNLVPVSTFSGAIAPLYLQSNPVIWSLSFEMFFYTVFAIGGIYKSRINHKFLITWFTLSILAIVGYYCLNTGPVISYLLQMMSFSCIWLTGFYIWHLKGILKSDIFSAVFSLCCLPLISRLHITSNYYDPIKYMMFSAASIPFFIFLCQLGEVKNQELKRDFSWLAVTISCFALSAFILIKDTAYNHIVKWAYILLPFCFTLFFNSHFKAFIRMIYYKLILLPFSYIGAISYSIYLIHFPILVIISRLPLPLLLKFVLALSMIYLVSFYLENVFQPFIKKIFKKLNKQIKF